MKIQLIGFITGNENAAAEFEAAETMLQGLYPDADIFNPIKRTPQLIKKNPTRADIQQHDALCFERCIDNLGRMTDKENDFVVAVNNFDSYSLANAEKIFCDKHNILRWRYLNGFRITDLLQQSNIDGYWEFAIWMNNADGYCHPHPVPRRMLEER